MPENVHPYTLRTACATLMIAGALCTQGCLFGKGKKPPKPFVPPPVYAKDPAAVTPTTVEVPPLGQETELDPGVEGTVVAGAGNLPPAPVKPATPPPKAPAAKPPVVAEAPAVVIPPPTPTAILSAAERDRMSRDIDTSLGKVRTALAKAEGRNLPKDLLDLANNARAFMLNAEQTRVQDLVTAVNLAKRAESFATELTQRLP